MLHDRAWQLVAGLVVAGALVLGGGAGLAAAQEDMRSLEDALGDSLDVRRDEAPAEPAPEGDPTPAGPTDGASGDGDGDPDADRGGGSSSGEQGSDGLREPVPADGGGDPGGGGDGGGATDAGSEDAPGPGGSEVDLDLEDRGEGVEGEGRGAGELVAGAPGRTVPIALAVLAVLGSGTALVVTQRRWERSTG